MCNRTVENHKQKRQNFPNSYTLIYKTKAKLSYGLDYSEIASFFFIYIYILKPKQNLRKILCSWKENVQLQMKQCWVCLSKIIKWCPHNRFKLIPLPFLVGSLTFFCRNQIKPGCTHLGWSQVAFYDAE